MAGTPFCRLHTPEVVAQRRIRRQKLKEQSQAAKERQRKLATLEPVRDLLTLLLKMVNAEIASPSQGGSRLSAARLGQYGNLARQLPN